MSKNPRRIRTHNLTAVHKTDTSTLFMDRLAEIGWMSLETLYPYNDKIFIISVTFFSFLNEFTPSARLIRQILPHCMAPIGLIRAYHK